MSMDRNKVIKVLIIWAFIFLRDFIQRFFVLEWVNPKSIIIVNFILLISHNVKVKYKPEACNI